MKENYIQIYGWMRTDLNLKGNSLIAYALIYGFCNKGKGEFTGSIAFTTNWLGCTRNTTISILKGLTSKDLINRIENKKGGNTYVKYTLSSVDNGLVVQKSHNCSKKNTLPPSSKIGPNNNIYNTSDTLYKESEFLEDWTACRKNYRKVPTNILQLDQTEKKLFRLTVLDFSKEQIRHALKGLFKQEQINYTSMITKPRHFLERVDTYLNAFIAQDFKLYGSKPIEY